MQRKKKRIRPLFGVKGEVRLKKEEKVKKEREKRLDTVGIVRDG